MTFRDRRDAGRQLAEALRGHAGEDTVVVGLARGGVPVAAEVARELGARLDALAVRKVGHPRQPEYALGAVTPGGGLVVRELADLPVAELQRAIERAAHEADELDRALHAEHPAADLTGRTCILVDDGLATGATMLAAVRHARAGGARRVVVAAPVGVPDTLSMLAAEADAVVCVSAPEHLLAVGAWYDDFSQVGEREVLDLLAAG
jgi:putative phosphoribosyl transferase